MNNVQAEKHKQTKGSSAQISKRTCSLMEESFGLEYTKRYVIGQFVGMTFPLPLLFPRSLCCRFTTKTNMADESSDEELNVQNGYDGELELYLAGDSGSDTSDSAGNFNV